MEEFKVIKNYETFGVNKIGQIKDFRTGLLKDIFPNPCGYLECNLQNPDGWKKFRVHRLVAITFIEKIENYDEVDHIDRNRTNNHVDNLRWANDIIQNNNKCGWGELPKYIYFENTNTKKNPYSSFIFQIRSKIYGSHKKRFRSDKFTLEDVLKYKEEYFNNVIL